MKLLLHLVLGNKKATEMATFPTTFFTYGSVSMKNDSRTVDNTTPDEAIRTNGMLAVIKD